jgi:hypothetical protein
MIRDYDDGIAHTRGEGAMSGEQRRNGLARPDQPDLIDPTLTSSRPAGGEQGRANGHRRDGLAQDSGIGAVGELHHRGPDGEVPEPAQAQAVAEPQTPAEPRRPAEHRAASAAETYEPARYRPDAVSSRPQPGSLADFRQRLERLPYGHPSSPYHVDGERKPPPPRLRHLELAPPAAAPARPPAHVLSSPVPPAPKLSAAPPPATVLPAAPPPATVLPAAAAPAPAAPTHFQPDRPGLAPPASQRPEARQAAMRPDPGPSPISHQADPVQSARPGGDAPRTAADGSWSWGPARLTGGQVRIAEDAYERFRAADGRSLLGGHDRGSGLTAAMRRIESLGHARLATGERALLPPDVFRARLADMLRRHPDRSPEQLSMRVPGALCYIFVLEDEQYADSVRDIEEALYNQGYQLQARKNGWTSPANRSVFTIWHDPFNDVPFQVQFHTEASLDAQRRGRSPGPSRDPGVPPAQAESIRLAGS